MTETNPRPIGRPALYGERMVTRQISLPGDAWATLQEKYGGDSYSATIRNALLRLVELERMPEPYTIEFRAAVGSNRMMPDRYDTSDYSLPRPGEEGTPPRRCTVAGG